MHYAIAGLLGPRATAVVQMLAASEVLDVRPPTPQRLVNDFST